MPLKIIINLCLVSFISLPAFASKMEHSIYFGYQNGRVSSDGFQDYFAGDYNNSDSSKQLYGGYLGGNYALENGLFISTDIYAVTRSSSSLIDSSINMGFSHALHDQVELFTSLGGNWISAERRSSCRNDTIIGPCEREVNTNKEFAAVVEVGSIIQINTRWSLVPSYSYSNALESGLNKFKISNVMKLTQLYSLEASYGYTFSKNLKQNNIKFGGRFTF